MRSCVCGRIVGALVVVLTLLGIAMVAPPRAQAADEGQVVFGVTADDVAGVIKKLDYDSKQDIDKDGDPRFTITLAGFKVVLNFYDKQNDTNVYTTFVLYSCYTKDPKVSADVINAWNRDKRFSRAYLNKDGDACVEADLDLRGGDTLGSMSQFIVRYRQTVNEFTKYIGF